MNEMNLKFFLGLYKWNLLKTLINKDYDLFKIINLTFQIF